jgi:hypothetical protein
MGPDQHHRPPPRRPQPETNREIQLPSGRRVRITVTRPRPEDGHDNVKVTLRGMAVGRSERFGMDWDSPLLGTFSGPAADLEMVFAEVLSMLRKDPEDDEIREDVRRLRGEA